MAEFSDEEYRSFEGFDDKDVESFLNHQQPLINILESDFTRPISGDDRDVLEDPDAHFIERLIAFSPKRPSHADAKLRYHSADATQLSIDVGRMLEDARITSTFKRRIADEVRRAYAEEKPVTAEIAPERLGITDDEIGIFDEDRAPDIEARHIRYFLLGIVSKNIRTQTVLHPDDFCRDMQDLDSWLKSYHSKFNRSPLDELNQRAFLMASKIYGEIASRIRTNDD